MTVTEFLLLHTTPGTNINFSSRVNVLFNTVGGSDEGIIEAITVTAQAFSVDGQQDPTSTDISNILEQVEEITFTFDNITYTLTVIERAFYSDSNAFFYFRVESDTLIPNIFDADISSNVPNGGDGNDPIVFQFQPFLNNIAFSVSDSNVVYNNVVNNRKSKFKFESDRLQGSVTSSNFAAILSTSASKAEIQDSFYTDTGLVNARYEGSSLSPSDLGDINPSLAAREFSGVIHPRGTSIDVACGLIGTPLDEITVNLLHTGPGILPNFVGSTLGIETNGALTVNDTSIDYNYVAAFTGQINPDIDAGDIITASPDITGSFISGSDPIELMRVLEHNVVTKKIIVERRYFSGSNQLLGGSGTIPDGTEFFKVDRTDVLQINELDTKLDSVGSSLVFVTNGNYVVHTDEFGAIFSQSICPDPLLLGIDNPFPQGD